MSIFGTTTMTDSDTDSADTDPRIVVLEQALANDAVPARDSGFVRSLVEQYHERNWLSARQWEYVEELPTRKSWGFMQIHDEIIMPVKAEPKLGCFERIASIFGTAADYAKKKGTKTPPRVTFSDDSLPGTGKLRLSLAGERSKHPGSINVTDGEPYPDGAFYGRIHTDGTFEAYRACTDAVLLALSAFATDPAAYAAEYGRRTSNCCFCSTPLTDDRPGHSIDVGYGPICAAKYGLPWGTPEQKEARESAANTADN